MTITVTKKLALPRSSLVERDVCNIVMQVLQKKLWFVKNTTAYHLDGYDFHLLLLNSSMALPFIRPKTH